MSQYSGIAKVQGAESSLNEGNVQIFQKEEFGQVRTTVDENGEPLFCLSDVCKILELQVQNTKKRLIEKGVYQINTLTEGGGDFLIIDGEKILIRHYNNRQNFVVTMMGKLLSESAKSNFFGNGQEYIVMEKNNF